ncbi:MAG: hypothetical protein NXI19_17000 [Alphaproteobacteria bacterium]|nr:hypothetical protein [Alphaproteobacteria bacterium]
MLLNLRIAFGLCVRDMLVDWRMSLCFILGLTAVLAPLIIMFGLKTGLVDGLRDRLLSDPRNLEIVIVGSGQFDADWFKALAARPDVGFVKPKTRAIAATITVTVPRESGLQSAEVADLIPTGIGDPLLEGITVEKPSDDRLAVVVSARLAEMLNLTLGEEIGGVVTRQRGGRRELGPVDLSVSAIAPAGLTTRAAIFVPVSLMEATESFRDGYGVPAFGWEGPDRPSERIYYAGARIYAKDLASVTTLHSHLTDAGLSVRSKASEVDGLNSFAESLTGGFLIIAFFSVIGFLVSLTASLWSNFERKRQATSFLRLIGMRAVGLIAIPIYQAVIIATAGFAGALATFFGAAIVIETVFADIGASVEGDLVVLKAMDISIFFAVTLGISVLASAVSSYGLSNISPAEGLRER